MISDYVDVAEEDIEGSPDLMAHVGQKGALEPRRFECGVACAGQFDLVSLLFGNVALLDDHAIGMAGQHFALGFETPPSRRSCSGIGNEF